jgi:hypothetical protein
LVADSQKKIPGRPNFLGKASAHFRTLGISEEAFNKLSGAQVTHSESLKAAQFLCDFYEGSIGASHPLLLPVYRGGLTCMAVGNILFHLEMSAEGSKERAEYLGLKVKAIQNLKQSVSLISQSKEYGRPGEEILNPVLSLLHSHTASYQELIRYIESF